MKRNPNKRRVEVPKAEGVDMEVVPKAAGVDMEVDAEVATSESSGDFSLVAFPF